MVEPRTLSYIMNRSKIMARISTQPFETGNLKNSWVVRKKHYGFDLVSPANVAGYGYFLDKGHNIVRGGRVIGKNDTHKGWVKNVRDAVAVQLFNDLHRKPNRKIKYKIFEYTDKSEMEQKAQADKWNRRWLKMQLRGD